MELRIPCAAPQCYRRAVQGRALDSTAAAPCSCFHQHSTAGGCPHSGAALPPHRTQSGDGTQQKSAALCCEMLSAGGSARRAASSTSSHFGTTISAVASLKLHVPETTNTGSHFCPQEMFTLHPQQPEPPPRAATRPPVPHSPSRSSREARHHATAFHQHQLLL